MQNEHELDLTNEINITVHREPKKVTHNIQQPVVLIPGRTSLRCIAMVLYGKVIKSASERKNNLVMRKADPIIKLIEFA
jgi:hypothetical protein